MKEKQKTFELEPVQQLLPADAQQRVMDQLYQFMELEHLYESAIREVKTKLEILDSEFKTKYDHNPIHHLEDRAGRREAHQAQGLHTEPQAKRLPQSAPGY